MTVGRAEVIDAAERIERRVRRTPVIEIEVGGHRVVLKLELLQHTGSFKPRGAFNRVLGAPSIPGAGVIAASGGNHGVAVAFVAAELGLAAEIFIPEVSPEIKVEAIRAHGASARVGGELYADALNASRARAAKTGALQVHAYDHELTVAGQGTMSREISEQVPDVAEVLIAVGGGGLVAGAAAWFEDRVRLVAVEPVTSRALGAAIAAGAPVDVEVSGLAADSLGARSIGAVPWSVLDRHTPDAVTVPDEAIAAAQRWFWRNLRLVVEPGGATAFAAVLAGAHTPRPDGSTVIVVCGANADPGSVTGAGSRSAAGRPETAATPRHRD